MACGCGGAQLSGKIVGYDPRTGEMLWAQAGLGMPLEQVLALKALLRGSQAGLGETYPITLPVIGPTTVDIPVDRIVHDAVDATGKDLWTRARANWYWLVGAAVIAGAAIALRRKKK